VPVTIKVNGTANSLVHKGCNGISAATIPDVCKTPSPGGPVPIPYPNISQSATLAKGTTTVKADGMMAAIKGSEFSLSNGDEAGVAGGVKSSTFIKESTWILYSFDVKMDGQNACRLTDKKFQNHENTADLSGVVFTTVVIVSTGSESCPTCKTARGDSNTAQTKSYEEFFSDDERKMFDRIRTRHPDIAPMLPPTNGRYKVLSKPARDNAVDRFRKAKKKAGETGSGDDDHHPHPIKVGGCPIHQELLRKPSDPKQRRRADLFDKLINNKVGQAITRNG
jgi:uncharacterized Zn-binding protein involved in type VI secretion